MKQSVGKGTVYLMLAEGVALLSSYGLQVWIAHYLGAAAYGIFGVLTSLYLINRAFLNTGIPRATSKFVAEGKDALGAIFTISQKVQMYAGLLFMLLYVFLAPLIAFFLKDLSLTPYIIYLGIIVFPLSMLSCYTTGFLNGRHLFREQGRVKIIYPILQLVFTFILVLLGFKIYGILTGYFLATIIALYFAWKYVGEIKPSTGASSFNYKILLKFAIPISLSAVIFALLRHANLLFIKAILQDNIQVAYFTAAATLSSLPFSIFGALPATLLPAISGAMGVRNIEKARRYIKKSLRCSLMVLLPLSAAVAGLSREILDFLYPASYQAAALSLAILIFASTFLALFTILNTVIVASGRPLLQLTTVFISLILLVIFNILLVPLYGIAGSAFASLFSALFAFIFDAFHVRKYFGSFMDLGSLLRIGLGTLLVFIIAYYIHFEGFRLIPYILFLGVLYLIFLILIGEIRKQDWEFILKILKREKSGENKTLNDIKN